MVGNSAAWASPYGVMLIIGLIFLIGAIAATIWGLVTIWSKWTVDNTTKIVWTLIDLLIWPVGWIAVAFYNASLSRKIQQAL